MEVETSDVTHGLYALFSITRFCTDTCTDSCCTHVDGQEIGSSFVQVLDFVFEDAGKAVECLAQCHRHSVLQLSTTHFDDVGEFLTLCTERSDEFVQMRNEAKVLVVQTYMDSCRVSVVG